MLKLTVDLLEHAMYETMSSLIEQHATSIVCHRRFAFNVQIIERKKKKNGKKKVDVTSNNDCMKKFMTVDNIQCLP
jgi:hypothetical protein